MFRTLVAINGTNAVRLSTNEIVKVHKVVENAKKEKSMSVKKSLFGRIIGFEVDQLPTGQV